MEAQQPLHLPLRFNQLLDIVKQLSTKDKQKLMQFLLNRQTDGEDLTLTHFASEHSLAKDWLTKIEDEAWENL